MRCSGIYMNKAGTQRVNITGINPRKSICVHLVAQKGQSDPVYGYGEVFKSIGACERAYDLKRLRNNRAKTLWNSAADEYIENGVTVRYYYIAHRVDEDCSVVSE